jgi:hypothetical protein
VHSVSCIKLYIAGLPDFSSLNVPKWRKIYQYATNLPNGHKMSVPNGRNIFQMAIKYLYQRFFPKFTQIGIFGPKIYHLATLQHRRKRWKEASHVAPGANTKLTHLQLHSAQALW